MVRSRAGRGWPTRRCANHPRPSSLPQGGGRRLRQWSLTMAAADQSIAAPAGRKRRPLSLARVASYLQALPLWLILAFFLAIPILFLVVISFWDYDFAR